MVTGYYNDINKQCKTVKSCMPVNETYFELLKNI